MRSTRVRPADRSTGPIAVDPAAPDVPPRGLGLTVEKGSGHRQHPDLGAQVPDPVFVDQRCIATAALKVARGRHRQAVYAIFEVPEQGAKASTGQVSVLTQARAACEAVRPDGWHDAKAAYAKDPALAFETASRRSAGPSASFRWKPKSGSTTPARTDLRSVGEGSTGPGNGTSE